VIDQNRDGFIDKDDLIEMMTSLGKNPADELLDAMIQEAPGPINFTMFLTLFGDKLSGTDPEDVIVNAFACFDEKHTGVIIHMICGSCFATVLYLIYLDSDNLILYRCEYKGRFTQLFLVLSCPCRWCELNWRQDKTVSNFSFVLSRPSFQFATALSA